MNDENDTPLIYKIIVVIVIVAAIFATFMGILNFALVRSNSSEISNLEGMIGSINGNINEMNTKLSSLNQMILPGGVVDEYINSYNFLSNTNLDLERMMTFSSIDPTSDYFTIYTTGKKGVWIGVTKNGQTILQADMRPGLSYYFFFVSSTPTVKTSYTFLLDKSCVITSSNASSTYFLVSRNGSSDLIRMKKQSEMISEFYH